MSMSVTRQYSRVGFDTRITPFIRKGIVYLKETAGVEEWHIDPTDAHVYKGDFYSLLHRINVDPKLWYPLLTLNKIAASTEYTGGVVLKKFSDDSVVTTYIDVVSAKISKDLTDN